MSVEDINKANYRVIWSEDSTEKRNGPNEPEIMLKYGYIKDRYILEGYNSANKKNPELAQSDGYEPIWVFQDKDGKYLPPELWACQFIIDQLRNFTPPPKRTEKMDFNAEQELVQKEAIKTESDLKDQGSSEIGMQFRYGEAVDIDPGKVVIKPEEKN